MSYKCFFSKLRNFFQIVFGTLSQCFIKFLLYLLCFFFLSLLIFLLSTHLFLHNFHASFKKNFETRFFGLAIGPFHVQTCFFSHVQMRSQ
jgi:hypothetical protein